MQVTLLSQPVISLRKEYAFCLSVTLLPMAVGDVAVEKMVPTEERNLKDLNHTYGHSYMMLCAARIQSDYPDQETQFFNRGISGNTLRDLQERWQADCLDLNPDVVTLLIGTNDVEQYLSGKAPLDMQQWEHDHRQLLDQLREANPDVRIALGTTLCRKGWKNRIG